MRVPVRPHDILIIFSLLFWQGWDAGGRAEREGESGREDGRTEGVTSVCDVTSRCDVMRGAA